MREPAYLSRRAAAALPLAAFAGAARQAPAADADLLDLGRQWAAANDRAFAAC